MYRQIINSPLADDSYNSSSRKSGWTFHSLRDYDLLLMQCSKNERFFFFPVLWRLKERFLIRRNKTKRANFRCNHLFRATYNTERWQSTLFQNYFFLGGVVEVCPYLFIYCFIFWFIVSSLRLCISFIVYTRSFHTKELKIFLAPCFPYTSHSLVERVARPSRRRTQLNGIHREISQPTIKMAPSWQRTKRKRTLDSCFCWSTGWTLEIWWHLSSRKDIFYEAVRPDEFRAGKPPAPPLAGGHCASWDAGVVCWCACAVELLGVRYNFRSYILRLWGS